MKIKWGKIERLIIDGWKAEKMPFGRQYF